jgi:hypothetical protein
MQVAYRAALVSIAVIFALLVFPKRGAAEASKQTLDAVRESVMSICQSPNGDGTYVNIEGEGEAGVSVQILKLVGSGAAKGKAKFSKEEWTGIRKVADQAAENKDYRACVRELTPKFLDKFSEIDLRTMSASLAWEGGIYSGPILDDRPDGRNGKFVFKSETQSSPKYVTTYTGNFVQGRREGEGTIVVTADGRTIVSLSGNFANNAFLSGSGRIKYDDRWNAFNLRVSANSSMTRIVGTYAGQLKNLEPGKSWVGFDFWRDFVADGDGELVGSYFRYDSLVDYQVTWKGGWKENAMVGTGRVTYPDGGYEEGLFYYRTLVEGKVVARSSKYYWAVELEPPIVYSGEIRNGVPQGAGSMSSDSLAFPIKLDGIFGNGKILNGFGYEPNCVGSKQDCSYGLKGEWRNGVFFQGTQTIPIEHNDRVVEVDTWEVKDGKSIKRTVERRP